jgi:hypothetical protein
MFRSAASALGAALLVTSIAARAEAQACCASAGAVTPARLAMHEDALVGADLRAATLLGSFDDEARYRGVASGTSEEDFSESVFGAIRFLERAQASLIVPVLETRRATRTEVAFGGGLGDLNVGARYDLTLAGRSTWVPGVGLLVGITVPTGTPPDAAHHALATDATGIGAWQGTIGVGVEQTFGPWYVGLSGLASQRTSRSVAGLDAALGPQATIIAAAAYSFPNDAALALVGSYSLEGSARLDGVEAPGSARHVASLALSGLLPLSDRFRLRASVDLEPPLAPLGRNQPVTAGVTFGFVWSWS